MNWPALFLGVYVVGLMLTLTVYVIRDIAMRRFMARHLCRDLARSRKRRYEAAIRRTLGGGI